jgi:uncharacterized UBP type Zn finger protein
MKTEKTTLELELDANIKYTLFKVWIFWLIKLFHFRYEYSSIQEDGSKLQNVYGPGFTGLINLGSSCYINSVCTTFFIFPIQYKLTKLLRLCKCYSLFLTF